MKIKGKILSVILSLTMITSVLPISSLVANAGVEMSGGSGGSYGVGDSNWMYGLSNNAIVMRIGASAITDKTTEDNMAKEVYRYGNQNDPEMHKYPLFIRAAVNGGGGFVKYNSVPTGTYSDDYSEDLAQMYGAINEMNGDINNSNKSWRESHNEEYWNGYGVKYKASNIVAGIKMSDKDCSASSVYLEDAIKRVVVLRNNDKIKDNDLRAFWYFYTRMAAIAKASRYGSGSTGYTTGMGEGIRKYLINGDSTYNYPVIKNENRKLFFQRGYIIALYAIYGNNAIKAFTGSDFSENSTRIWTNGFKSIVFDKCWTGLAGGNGCVSKNVLISGHTYAEISKTWNRYSINPYEENSSYKGGNDNTSSIWFTKIGDPPGEKHLWSNLLPAYTYDQKNASGQITNHSGDQRGKDKFRGWCYVELATDGGVPLKRQFNDYKNAQMSITYNGYLSPDRDSNYTKDSETFGDNGHVMTDLVYLSSPVADDDLEDLKGFDAKVPSSIRLSTPFENTQFNLKKLQYRVVNAFGVTYDSDSKEIVYASGNGNSQKVNIPFNTLENQWGKDSNSYKIRNKYKIEVAGFGDSYIENGVTKNYTIYKSTGSALEVDDGKKVSSIKNCSWNTLKGNTDKFNTNCSYIKLVNGSVYPIIKENGIYYLVPVQFVSNLLVEVRADYTGKYTRDNVLSYKAADGTTKKKSVTIQEYLLSKNYNTGDLTGQRLYSMLDNYATNVWGDVYNRSNAYSDNTRTGVSMYKTRKNGQWVGYSDDYYSYSVGTLFNSSAEFWTSQSFFNNNVSDYAINNDSILQNHYRLYKTGKVSGEVAKLQFKKSVNKTAPLVANRDDKNSSLTILNSNLSTWVKSYGNTLIPNNSTVEKYGLYYTELYRDANGNTVRDRSKSSINSRAHSFIWGTEKFYIKPALRRGNKAINNVSNIFNVTYNTANTNKYQAAYLKDKVSRFAAEKAIGMETDYDGMIDMTGNDKIKASLLSPNGNDNNYVQAIFPKLLATYMNYLYEKRGKIAANLTPSIAAWDTSSSNVAAFTNDYAMNSGIINNINYVGHTTKSKVIDNGFIRYAKTGDNIQIRDTSSKSYQYMLRMNSRGRPLTIANYDTATSIYDSSVDSPFSSTTFTGKSYNLIAPWTQSSYDIPIRYTVLSHVTQPRDKQAITTTFSKSGSKISMLYQYSNSDLTTGIYKYGSTNGTTSDNWKYNKVSLGVFPEVKMWAENDKTSNPKATTTYTTVKTVGAKQRYIPAMTYTTLDLSGLNVDAQVIGTAVAYDTRAKKLAQSLGTADTQVIYSGTAVNGTITSKASGTLKTYALDFRGGGVLNGQDIKTGWKNNNYDSKNVASKAMSVVLDQFKVNSSANMAIYNGKTLTNVDVGISSMTDGDLSASSPVNGNVRYNLYIRGSQIYQVIVYTRVGNNYVEAIRYRFIDPDGNNERGGYTKLVETGTNKSFWYNTGSCKIKAVNGKYIYNGTTELTATEKANYLAIYNGNPDVTKSTFTNLRTLLTNMRLYGNYNVLANTFEYNTGVDLPNGLKNSTGGKKSYNEDCSVLQIREYTATVTSGDSKATFTEQIPINAGPSTPIDKNMYFSNGYKAFVDASVKVVAKNDLKNSTDAIIVAKNTVFASDVVKHKVKGSTTEVVVDNASKAKTAIPDFIIGDVPISEALSG